MIISEQKPFKELLDTLAPFRKVFLIGCGDCATACRSGGEEQLLAIRRQLEEQGKTVTGISIPESTCVSAKIKTELAKNTKALAESEAIVVFSCGLGVQSVKENDRRGLKVLPGCNTIFGATMDSAGNFFERCSLCGDCVLAATGGICPVTLCAKGLLNGPCGGMNKGKCELDAERDCAWVLIYNELKKKNELSVLKRRALPRDYKKSAKPHKLLLNKQLSS